MLRYVPDFILNRAAADTYSGSLSGFVLFADIAGFTDLSNVLRKEGKKGAEALHQYLHTALAYPIHTVESHGGFVSHFAGDAFYAVFPEGEVAELKQVVDDLVSYSAQHQTCHTGLGDFPLKVRITLCSGKLDWQVYRLASQYEYVFAGSPLHETKALSAQKHDLALSPAVQAAFAEVAPKPLSHKHSSFQRDEAQASKFLNSKLQGISFENEIRDAAYCFIDLSLVRKDRIAAALELIHDKLDNYGGFLNKLDAGDKGLVALVLFGLPKAMGNTLERACRFALETINTFPGLAIGLSCGNAYAGYVGSESTQEYTALGSAVNLASRLMQKAKQGEILTDSYLEQEMHYKYRFEPAATVTLKGFTTPVHSNRLFERLPAPPQSFMADLVGRDEDLGLIRQAVEEPGSRIVYISGEPGIGKSRLILEALKPYPKRYFLFCDPSGHRLLEPIKQFLRQYFAYDLLLSREQNQKSYRQQWEQLAGEDKELQRIESIVGNLLGLEWEGSIWSILPPEERPEQQRRAFATLLARITEAEKVIIHLDDPQWLDDSDTEYFRQLGTAKIDNIAIIAACRYLEDGTPVNLEIPNWEARNIELNRLSEDASSTLICHLLQVDALPPETRDWIVKKADGNPLFIEQVAAYLKENDCFDSAYRLKGNLDYLSSFGIADIIGSRIDSLTDSVRNTLQHACVLGLEFNTRVLSEMLSRKLDDDLGEGKQARVWADVDELRYIFTHVLIKDTAYNRMLSDKLQKLHLLAAETMERMYQDDEQALKEHAEEIAGHYENAGKEEKAAKYYDIAGCWYKEQYDWIKSESLLKIALAIREKVLGAEHQDTATSLNNLACLHEEQGKYSQAESQHIQALAIREKCLGPDHPDTADSLNNLAILYKAQGKYSQSESLHLRALAIREKYLGPDHLDTATSLNGLAILYKAQGKYAQAEPLYLRAHAIKEKCLGSDHPETAITLNNLAILYEAQGRYDQAESLYLRSWVINEQSLGTEHPSTALSLDNLASLYQSLGKYSQAEPLLSRALAIYEQVYGVEHLDTAISYNNLACLCQAQGKYDQANHLFLQVLEINEKILGAEHPEIARTLNNIAGLYFVQGKYTEAEHLHQRALSIREQTSGPEHPDTAITLNNLANLYQVQRKYAQAEPLFLRAIVIKKKVLGTEHPSLALTLNSLATMYYNIDKYDQAESLFLQALEIRKKNLGREHQKTQQTLKGLIDTYEKLNQHDKAAEYRAILIPKAPEGE